MQEPREILNSDDMFEMTEVSPHYEFGCDHEHIYIFTVNGRLKGREVRGALFAAECMVVSAKTFELARELAKEGLISTRNFLMEEAFTRPMREAQNDGIDIDVAGRKGNDVALKDQKLINMLDNYIGKKH